MQKAYYLIMGQRSKVFTVKVGGMHNHFSMNDNGDPILLLGDINTLMFNFQSTKYPPHYIHC